MICAGLEFFDAHLFQEPATPDLLPGDHFKALRELAIPIVAFHFHEGAARLVDPQQNIGILRLTRRGAQLQLPAIARADIFGAQNTPGRPVEELEREVFVANASTADLLAELRSRKFLWSGARHEIKARAFFPKAQL